MSAAAALPGLGGRIVLPTALADLRAARRLRAAGIDTVEPLGLDTYSEEDRFFSYRRATHRGEPTYGRQFSLIGLPG